MAARNNLNGLIRRGSHPYNMQDRNTRTHAALYNTEICFLCMLTIYAFAQVKPKQIMACQDYSKGLRNLWQFQLRLDVSL